MRRDDGPLFREPSSRGLPEQQENIARVRSRIGLAVLAFVRGRIADGRPYFHAEDLRRYVEENAPGAPGSPDRILRDLRQNRALDYEVVNRADSYYCAKWAQAAK